MTAVVLWNGRKKQPRKTIVNTDKKDDDTSTASRPEKEKKKENDDSESSTAWFLILTGLSILAIAGAFWLSQDARNALIKGIEWCKKNPAGPLSALFTFLALLWYSMGKDPIKAKTVWMCILAALAVGFGVMQLTSSVPFSTLGEKIASYWSQYWKWAICIVAFILFAFVKAEKGLGKAVTNLAGLVLIGVPIWMLADHLIKRAKEEVPETVPVQLYQDGPGIWESHEVREMSPDKRYKIMMPEEGVGWKIRYANARFNGNVPVYVTVRCLSKQYTITPTLAPQQQDIDLTKVFGDVGSAEIIVTVNQRAKIGIVAMTTETTLLQKQVRHHEEEP